jgi:hypothetical protein
MTSFALVPTVAFAPLLAVPIFYRIHLHRQTSKLERNGGVEAAFAPADPPAPGFLLRRFSLPERAYLLRYRPALLAAFGILLWLFLVNMSGGLLPSAIASTGFTGSVQQNIWYSYIDQLTDVFVLISMISLTLGLIAVTDIGMIEPARFPRSRPISRRLLFWGRVLPSLATILTTFVIAALLSLLLLRICYGPVYNHLQNAASTLSHPVTPDGDSDDLTLLLQTSVPRIFLSGITTFLLGFSIAVAAIMLPFQIKRQPILGVLMGLGIMSYQSFFISINFAAPAFARILFIYTVMGPPPPYVFALVPILISTALLLLASKFSNRLQT